MLLWDVNIRSDHVVGARGSDILFVNKMEEYCTVNDIVVPGGEKFRQRQKEKVERDRGYADVSRAEEQNKAPTKWQERYKW